MKQMILFVLLGMTLNVAAAQKYFFTLKGDILHAKGGKVELYSPEDSVNVLLCTDIKDGIFTLSGELNEPGYYYLYIAGVKFPILLDGEDMILYGDCWEPDTRLLKGSPGVKTRLALDDLYGKTYQKEVEKASEVYRKMTDDGKKQSNEAEDFINKAVEKAREDWRMCLLDFAKKHPDDLYVPVFVLMEMGDNVAWGKKAHEFLTPEIKASQPGRLLKQRLTKE